MSTVARPLSVLIVGGGVAGSILAASLAPALAPHAALWEKSTSTGRTSHSTARGAAAGAVSDLGAQYFTQGVTPAGDARLRELVASRVLVDAPSHLANVSQRHAGAHNFIAPAGAGSIVQHFRERAVAAGVALLPSTHLVSLDAVPGDGAGAAGSGSVWRAEAACGRVAFARAVVLTIPPPQIPNLRGSTLISTLDPLASTIAACRYSTRLALALYFAAADAPLVSAAAPWMGAFVDGNTTLRYLSNEGLKRAAGGDGAAGSGDGMPTPPPPTFPTIVAHSTIEYGLLHRDTPEYARVLEPELRSAALHALSAASGMPVSALPIPIETRVHRWKFSQVLQRAIAPGGRAAALLGGGGGATPPLILAGDAWARDGNFSGAAESADDARMMLEAELSVVQSQ